MPHDCNGTEIRAGDKVALVCEVESVIASCESFCNANIRPVQRPAGEPGFGPYTINTKYLRLEQRAPPAPPGEPTPA